MAELILHGKDAAMATQIFAKLFGQSIFTTMAAYGDQICLWPRHYARLHHHCAHLGYDLPQERLLLEAIQRHLPPHAKHKIRILVAQKNHALSFEEFIKPPAKIYDGVAVHLSNIPVDEHSHAFKSTNRPHYELALHEAQARDCFEALMVDGHGHVVDGARTSLLIHDGKKSFTWPLGGLDGVMRSEVASHLVKKGFVVQKRHVGPNDLRGQLILCNSLLGVVPVGKIKYPAIRDLVERFYP